MDKILLMLFLFLVSCGSSKQDRPKSESGYNSKIISAYNYVAKKYSDKIVVSNELTDIDIVNFTEEISKKKGEEMSVVLDSLIKVKEQAEYKAKQYPIKKLVKNTNKKGGFKMFFSGPKENYLMVEVFDIYEGTDYEKLSMFGSSDVYLLYFKGKEIIDNYQIKLNYN